MFHGFLSAVLVPSDAPNTCDLRRRVLVKLEKTHSCAVGVDENSCQDTVVDVGSVFDFGGKGEPVLVGGREDRFGDRVLTYATRACKEVFAGVVIMPRCGDVLENLMYERTHAVDERGGVPGIEIVGGSEESLERGKRRVLVERR